MQPWEVVIHSGVSHFDDVVVKGSSWLLSVIVHPWSCKPNGLIVSQS